MKIAGNKTVNQWKELERTLKDEDNACWDCAFAFFEERMETRYFKPIEAILKIGNDIGKGFAIVNLQCSLIETIECFVNGAVSHSNGKTIWKGINGDEVFKYGSAIFTSFFSKREPFKLFNINGSDFYKNVRCGLLHETQTKNGWEIRIGKKEQKSISNKTIYRENLHSDLRKLMDKYKSAIVEGKDFDGIINKNLRQNFRNKFNHLCEISVLK